MKMQEKNTNVSVEETHTHFAHGTTTYTGASYAYEIGT